MKVASKNLKTAVTMERTQAGRRNPYWEKDSPSRECLQRGPLWCLGVGKFCVWHCCLNCGMLSIPDTHSLMPVTCPLQHNDKPWDIMFCQMLQREVTQPCWRDSRGELV